MIPLRFQFTLYGLAGFVLVAAMALAPISAGISANTLIAAFHRAVVGLLGVAALSGLRRDRSSRLASAAGGSLFLLVSGVMFRVPAVVGRPDLGLLCEAVGAIAFGILGGVMYRRLAATGETASPPLLSG